MDTTATYRYDAVRFAPLHDEFRPFQVLGSTFRSDVPQYAVVELTLDEAIDLHEALGRMIPGVANV